MVFDLFINVLWMWKTKWKKLQIISVLFLFFVSIKKENSEIYTYCECTGFVLCGLVNQRNKKNIFLLVMGEYCFEIESELSRCGCINVKFVWCSISVIIFTYKAFAEYIIYSFFCKTFEISAFIRVLKRSQ